MLNLQAFKSTALQSQPFDWALVEHAIAPADADALLDSFPAEDFWVIEDDDGEKSYSYAARPLVTLGADRVAPLAPLATAWEELAADLLSAGYRRTLGELIGRPLEDALMEASLWRWDADAQLGPHRDLASKIVTQVFYLSREWDPAWGGCLRILRSNGREDVAAELPPANGSASVLVRSERSWHSVTPVQGAAPEPRRSVIVTWFAPEATSPVWQVREDGSVTCVASGSVLERPRAPAPSGALSARGATRPSAREAAVPASRPSRGGRLRQSPNGAPGRSGRSAPSASPAAAAGAPPATRVAMAGAFDIANFGDLLLPLIAAHELGERLGAEYRPTLYSYRPMSGAGWPHEVRSLGRLAEEIERFDLLLVGGGQIVRFDRAYPAGYGPVEASVHHPLGLWLTPMLLAAAAGVQIAWNVPGVSADIPEWLDPLIATAVRHTAHLAVRDETSAEMLAARVPDAPLRTLPDSAFGIGALLGEEPTSAFEELALQLGIAGGYVVLQPSPELAGFSAGVREVIGAARERGLAVLELPLSPSHGDRAGALGALGETVTPPEWPHPLLIAELLARSQAVIAQSFHGGVVAVASGVPHYRPPSPAGWKYEGLESLDGVHLLADRSAGGAGPGDFGRCPPGPGARERVAQLAGHWEAVAAAARTGRDEHAQGARELIAGLPHWLDASAQAAADREGALLERIAEIERARTAGEAEAAARIEALERDFATLLRQKDELSARASALGGELAAARARNATLEELRERKIVRLGLAVTSPLALLKGRRAKR